MLTYQLQTRRFVVESGPPFSFPNGVILEIKLGPSYAFGADATPGRTAVKSHRAELLINANTGKWVVQSDPPLRPLDVTIETPAQRLALRGDLLRYEFFCASLDELDGTLTAFKWVYPTLLNLDFADPPIVLWARGRVGETTFRWEVSPAEWRVEIWPTTEERLESGVVDSFNRLGTFAEGSNRRLTAALTYFHTATRLTVAGESPWEFMAEAILNYAKTLQILFSTSERTKDDVRRQLSILGYTEEEIEGDFIPILELRRVDVAHPKVALQKAADLKVLYRYIHQTEERMRRLLDRVVERVTNGSYQIPQTTLDMSADDRRHMRRLVDVMASRLTPEE